MVSIHMTMNKQELFDEGLKRCQAFCNTHGIPQPHHVFNSKVEANRHRRDFLRPKWLGAQMYENNEYLVGVNIKKCRVATRVPGWSWTYPGYKVDLTPMGVLCHEFGHHVDCALGGNGKYISRFKAWREVVDNEEEISGYEPNYLESFAETFRLFMTNPDLLRAGRPDRWEYFTETLSFKPIHTTPWKKVLKHAHPRIISAAERWIVDP
jgi:hypothetical protein